MNTLSSIGALEKVELETLLKTDLKALEGRSTGQWLVGLLDRKWPELKDPVLLIDQDIYAEGDIVELVYEGLKYVVVSSLDTLHDVRTFHANAGLATDTGSQLKSLVYYVSFDAFYDGSAQCEANWQELEESQDGSKT